MDEYLFSAISKLYGEDKDNDDFILLGLTGRTGSGCSTVAKILKSEKEEIKHSLLNHRSPYSNKARKERIVGEYFAKKWTKFSIVKATSIITLFLVLDCSSKKKDESPDYLNIDDSVNYLRNLYDRYPGKFLRIEENNLNDIKKTLKVIQKEYSRCFQDNKLKCIEFYTETLPELCKEIKNTLNKKEFVRIYQKIGSNIRMS
ncbi:MAG: hypothetical protein D3910_19360, partial [Candidatus Electrothrix sp. ATG2]|nr:hypothetical protein [Candidatus Electrothrix sp. ATG2]